MIVRLISRLRSDCNGVAALEFALVLPMLITAFFGTVELIRAIDTNRKLSYFVRTLADLSGRADNPNPTSSDMATLAAAATVIMRPLDTSGLRLVVNAMGVKSYGGTLYGGVCSSWAQNATQRPSLTVNGTNGLPPTPAAYVFDGARYILAEASMDYIPLVGSNLYRWIFGAGGLTFTRQIPWAERTTAEIVMPGGSKCPT